MFMGKTLHSHSATLYPGVQKGAREFHVGGGPAMNQEPIQRERGGGGGGRGKVGGERDKGGGEGGYKLLVT